MSCSDIEWNKVAALDSIAKEITTHLSNNLLNDDWRKNLEYEVKAALQRKVNWEDICTMVDLPSEIEVSAEITVGNKTFYLS